MPLNTGQVINEQVASASEIDEQLVKVHHAEWPESTTLKHALDTVAAELTAPDYVAIFEAKLSEE